jgi:hypothetical protein
MRIALLLGSAIAFHASGQVPATPAHSQAPVVNSPALGDWDVQGAGDPGIQGFATDISVDRGETIRFKIRTDAPAYHIEIQRLGYYAGAGAQRVAELRSPGYVAQPQPECLNEVATGLIDCGGWKESASWAVPPDARSGVYVARLIRDDTSGASQVLFVVRDDASRSAILLQTSDTTWQAYNDWGGNSLYTGAPAGRAYKVSYNRPLGLRGSKYRRASFWANEYPMIRWLEANGYDVTYTTGVDTARRGELLKQHKVFMSSGHDEYWAGAQRTAVEAARDAGVHLAFFSGNSVFWKTRWEPSIDGSGTPYRTLVTYKETHAEHKIDPTGIATGTWRDPRFSLPTDGARPENALKGTLFVANCCRFDSVKVDAAQGRARFWRNTPLAKLAPGTSAEVGKRVVGYEWDGDVDNGYRPIGLVRLSSTTLSIESALLDFGSRYGQGTVTHNITLYRHPSGSLVFAAGTALWGWALDTHHDDPDGQAAPLDPVLQQATANILADMSVLPTTPVASLAVTGPSDDKTPPVAIISTPTPFQEVMFHLPVKITGTVQDQGGVPAGVEVSIDGGPWHPADGVSNWSWEFTPERRGLYTVLARAVDDSGNVQQVPASVMLDVSGYGRLVRAAAKVAVLVAILAIAVYLAWRRRRTRAA